MELKQFITEVLTQIAEGTMGAAKVFTDNGGMINPKVVDYKGNASTGRIDGDGHSPEHFICNVHFSVALSEDTSKKGKGGIGVQLGVISLGGDKNSESSQSSLSQVEFDIQCVLPDVAGDKNSPSKKASIRTAVSQF